MAGVQRNITENCARMTFSQVICEFHAADRIDDPEWYGQAKAVLGKLNDEFAVVRVHGNNCGALLGVGNVRFPGDLCR